MPYRKLSDETWDKVREDYTAGDTAPVVCDRYGVGDSNLRKRAREEGWRKADVDDPAPLDDAELDDDDPPDLGRAADRALRRSLRYAAAGRGPEAARWLRLHRDYLALTDEAESRRSRLQTQKHQETAGHARAIGAAARAMLQSVRTEAAGGDVEAVNRRLDAVLDDWRPGEVQEVQGVQPVSRPLTRLDRERLIRARDKARRRGQPRRAAELQAALDQAAPP